MRRLTSKGSTTGAVAHWSIRPVVRHSAYNRTARSAIPQLSDEGARRKHAIIMDIML